VAEIRRALGDAPESPRFIRTAHRRGYAFIADVEDTEEAVRTIGDARCWLVIGDRTVMLPQGETVVGREPDCGVWINVASVSGRQARLVVRGRTAAIEDLQSTNGTFVRGARIRSRVELHDGDVVHLGEVAATFGSSGGRT